METTAIVVILTVLLAQVKQGLGECFDWQGVLVTQDKSFVPYRDAPCLLCWCVDGLPQNCVTQNCPPPPCQHFERIEGECCQVNCLDEDGRPINQTLPSKNMFEVQVPEDMFPSVMDHCCALGTSWYRDSSGRCPEYSPQALGTDCGTIIHLCCLQERQMDQCHIGTVRARSPSGCEGLIGVPGSEDASECCHCCELGLVAYGSGLPCDLLDSFSPQCNVAFKDCCSGYLSDDGNVTDVMVSDACSGQGRLCAHICIPTLTSFRCECREGFVLHSDGQSCQQVLPLLGKCAINNPCEHLCNDTGADIVCSCHPGYSLDTVDHRSCLDIDECRELPCDLPQRCINTPGSYRCRQPQPVAGNQTCSTGFAYNTVTSECDDIDECIILRQVACSPGLYCENTIGSYRCTVLDDILGLESEVGLVTEGDEELSGDDQTPTEIPLYVPSCGSGFKYNLHEMRCVDVDECATGKHRCTQRNQECRNSIGSYTCMCADGFRYDPTVFSCEDVDECELGTHTCPSKAECTNKPGFYECLNTKTCLSGYGFVKENNSCVDRDECFLGIHNCPLTTFCQNTDGSFECVPKSCEVGNELDEDTGDCIPRCRPSEVLDLESGRCVQKTCKVWEELDQQSGQCLRKSCQIWEELDELIGQCISKTCARGEDLDRRTGTCIKMCHVSEDYDKRTGRCIPKTCPRGEALDQQTGECVPKTCQLYEELNQQTGQCVLKQCYANEELDRRTGNCVPKACQVWEELDQRTGYCVPKSCEVWQELDRRSGQCLQKTCEVWESLDQRTGQCDVKSCRTGEDLDRRTGQCIPKLCRAWEELDRRSGNCIPKTCMVWEELNQRTGMCERNSCRTGEELDQRTGRCVPKTCQVWEMLDRRGQCTMKTCRPGENLDRRTGQCTLPRCRSGYKRDRRTGNCVDQNECLENARSCSGMEKCINMPGSYRCKTTRKCRAGFRRVRVSSDCEDIDECREGGHSCRSPLMTCTNQPGSYTCKCPEGYRMDQAKRSCEDIDECKYGSYCPTSTTCHNTPGSYRCRCNEGLRMSPHTERCEDLDECAQSRGLCQHECTNTWGSYVCTCNQGYQLATDGRRCEDIDECTIWSRGGIKLCEGECMNVPGSYQCACPHGYRKTEDTRSCVDLDECVTRQNNCNRESTCVNIRGGFKCVHTRCPTNFVRTQRRGEEGQFVCRRKSCSRLDSVCERNKTKSIQWHYVAIPTVRQLTEPMVLLNVHAIGYTTMPNIMFQITAGNNGMFDVIKTPGTTDKGAVRLLRPIAGPAVFNLVLQMDNINRRNRISSRHIAHITIYISPYSY